MSWFDDPDALRAGSRTSEYEYTRADEVNFMTPDRLPFVIAREVEIELSDATPPSNARS